MVDALLLHAIPGNLRNILQQMRKEFAGNGAAVGRAQRVEHAAFDSGEAGKTAAATAGGIGHAAEITALVSNEWHPVVVKIRDQNLRRLTAILVGGFDDQVLRVDVETVAALAFGANRHELAGSVGVGQ